MLTVEVPATEQFDERTNEFINSKAQTLTLEHSLLSLSKWESKWCIPFLGASAITADKLIDYIVAMTITKNVNPDVYNHLPQLVVNQIAAYIDSPMTATTFSGQPRPTREIVTSEVIYYQMFSLGIPKECEKWHLNRLLTLIKVFTEMNKDPKKRPLNEVYADNRRLNELRKKKYGTRG